MMNSPCELPVHGGSVIVVLCYLIERVHTN